MIRRTTLRAAALCWLLLIGLTAAAAAQDIPPTIAQNPADHPAAAAVAMLAVPDGFGSCVVVHVYDLQPGETAPQAIALTALHVIDHTFREQPRAVSPDRFAAVFAGDRSWDGVRELARDPDTDTAAVLLRVPPGTVAVPIAESVQLDSPTVTLCWADGYREARPGRLCQVTHSGGWVWVDCRVRPGNSGGAVIDADGCLVGIIKGGTVGLDDRPWLWPTICSGPAPMRRVLAAALAAGREP